MKTYDFISGYIGKKINVDAFNEILSFGRIYPTDFEPPAFGITKRIHDIWQSKGIIIGISLEYRNEVIASIDVDKYYDASQSFYFPDMRFPQLNQQELRIVRRILDYVTE